MAYLLATPVSRVKIAITQAAVLIVGLLIIVVVTYVAGIVGAEWFLQDNNLNKDLFLKINIVGGSYFSSLVRIHFLFLYM